ncbi:MAG: hypothetical protein J3K34DRAFT_426101 [Monoraphidium minutum]|nr:MAG: hypothetical protein J3K34DRAFT_426101 [Monoraphidium minutum]
MCARSHGCARAGGRRGAAGGARLCARRDRGFLLPMAQHCSMPLRTWPRGRAPRAAALGSRSPRCPAARLLRPTARQPPSPPRRQPCHPPTSPTSQAARCCCGSGSSAPRAAAGAGAPGRLQCTYRTVIFPYTLLPLALLVPRRTFHASMPYKTAPPARHARRRPLALRRRPVRLPAPAGPAFLCATAPLACFRRQARPPRPPPTTSFPYRKRPPQSVRQACSRAPPAPPQPPPWNRPAAAQPPKPPPHHAPLGGPTTHAPRHPKPRGLVTPRRLRPAQQGLQPGRRRAHSSSRLYRQPHARLQSIPRAASGHSITGSLAGGFEAADAASPSRRGLRAKGRAGCKEGPRSPGTEPARARGRP